MNLTPEGFLDVVDHLECRLFAFVVKMILNEEATDCHTHPVVGVYDALLPSRLVTCYSLETHPINTLTPSGVFNQTMVTSHL